jgi:hypothetical protein
MKKRAKKLVLAKETVRSMEEVANARGGVLSVDLACATGACQSDLPYPCPRQAVPTRLC